MGSILCLQKEIACVDNGLPVEKLPLFATCGGHIIMKLSLSLLVRKGNNHQMIHRTFEELRGKNIPITLPAIKGKKGNPISEQRFTLKLEKGKSSGYDRTLHVKINKDFAYELLRTSNGLTSLSQDVIWNLNSAFALKIYEIISHWKDKSSMIFSLQQFRSALSIGNKMKETKELI